MSTGHCPQTSLLYRYHKGTKCSMSQKAAILQVMLESEVPHTLAEIAEASGAGHNATLSFLYVNLLAGLVRKRERPGSRREYYLKDQSMAISMQDPGLTRCPLCAKKSRLREVGGIQVLDTGCHGRWRRITTTAGRPGWVADGAPLLVIDGWTDPLAERTDDGQPHR